jgi:hypothetical protein
MVGRLVVAALEVKGDVTQAGLLRPSEVGTFDLSGIQLT